DSRHWVEAPQRRRTERLGIDLPRTELYRGALANVGCRYSAAPGHLGEYRGPVAGCERRRGRRRLPASRTGTVEFHVWRADVSAASGAEPGVGGYAAHGPRR